MNDKEYATLAAKAAISGIELTRRDGDSFTVKRGEHQFWFTCHGDTHVAVETCDDIHDVLQHGVQEKTRIAPKFEFHITGTRVPQQLGSRRLAKEIRAIFQTEMPGWAVVEITPRAKP